MVRFSPSKYKYDALDTLTLELTPDPLRFDKYNTARFEDGNFLRLHVLIDQEYVYDDALESALDNVKQQMADYVNELIYKIATPVQWNVYDLVVQKGYEYDEAAKELDVRYFSVHAALHGQKDNNKLDYYGKPNKWKGRMTGGLIKKLRKKLKKDETFQKLMRDRKMINAGNNDVIELYNRNTP